MFERRARVSLAKCSSYDAAVRDSLERLLNLLGDVRSLIQPGSNVLLKPNLLTDRTPADAVTTHPEVVRAMIRIVRDAGGRPSVADSPNSVVRLERVWEKTGMRALCDEEDVPLLNLERCGSVPFEDDGFSFSISRPVLEADVVINLPKAKTHVLTTLTGAVKNTYGAVPGYQKALLHKLHPTPAEFGRLMAAVHRRISPALNVMDGIIGMHGNGPSGGRPIPLGFLAASTDAFALDLTLCRILKLAPAAVPYLKDNAMIGKIEIVGADPDDLGADGFVPPSTMAARLMPARLIRMIESMIWIRPTIGPACTRCGRCVEACPCDALHMPDKTCPELNPTACIGCCCCHETCPENAITMIQSPLLRLVCRLKMS